MDENGTNEQITIDFKRIFALVRRWYWLGLLLVLVGLAAGLVFSLLQVPVYQSATKVLIERANQNSQTGDMTAYLSIQQLTQTYVQLLQTNSVLKTVSERLGIEIKAEDKRIRVIALRDTNIIQIDVEDTDPVRAAGIANELVKILIEQNELIQAGRYTSMEQSLQAQKLQIEDEINRYQKLIDDASLKTVGEQKKWVETQITDLQAEGAALQMEIDQKNLSKGLVSKAGVYELNARLEQIQMLLPIYQEIYSDLVVYGRPAQDALTDSDSGLALLHTTQALYQQIYVSVLTNLESVRLARLENTPNVVQIEPASIPEHPIRPKTLLNTILAGMAGAALAVSAVMLIEYLDDTMKTPEDVERVLGLNVIGYIADIQEPKNGASGVYAAEQPRSPITEAFRSLRTNIEYSGIDHPIRTIMVTSSEPGDGKSTIAVNLAEIFAQRGQRVLLLDADLRRPRLHTFFGFQNRVGLTTLVKNGVELHQVCRQWSGDERLSIITAGSLPPNPAELLGSARMKGILEELKARFDLIVIDCPPSVVADAQVLAARVDGVLLVLQPGKTARARVRAAHDQLSRTGVRILGIVMNRIPRNSTGYYGGYQQYVGDYYYSKET